MSAPRSDPPALVDAASIARLLDVEVSAIADLVRAGMPRVGRRYSAQQCVIWYIRYLHRLHTRDAGDAVGRGEIAALLGITERQVTNLVKQHAEFPSVVEGSTRLFPRAQCVAWYLKFKIAEAMARRGDTGTNATLDDARIEKLQAEIELVQMEVAERRAQLVTVDFMRSEFQRMTDAMRAKLLSIPSAWEPSLGACETPVDRQLALQELVNQLLPILGATADDDGEDDGLTVASA